MVVGLGDFQLKIFPSVPRVPPGLCVCLCVGPTLSVTFGILSPLFLLKKKKKAAQSLYQQ